MAEPGAIVDVHLLSTDGELSGAAGAQAVSAMHLSTFLGDGSVSGVALYLAQCDLSDLPALAREAPKIPPFCRGVMPQDSETKRHLWLNRGQRVRSQLHYDGYDNVLCCMRGCKTLVLLPPRDAARKHVHPCPAHSLSPNQADPDPEALRSGRSLELRAGDCLYIPAGWWHQVDSEPDTLAISYWWHAAGARALAAELSDELPDDSCAAAFILREAARALVLREQRRRLDLLSRTALPAPRAPHSPADLATALVRAHASCEPRWSGRPFQQRRVREEHSSAALTAKAARAQTAALVWTACAHVLAAALLLLERRSAHGFVRGWAARLDARAAYALVCRLDEAGGCARCGDACARPSAPPLSEVLFACAAEEVGPSALRARLIQRADAYSHRVCAVVVPRTIGMAGWPQLRNRAPDESEGRHSLLGKRCHQ